MLLTFLQPDEVFLLFNELESIVNNKLHDKAIWKKCLTVTMDTCMELFSQVYDKSNIFYVLGLSISLCIPLTVLFPITLILVQGRLI